MTTFLAIIYILLILIFLVVSTLILRHTLKFSYLSPRFRKIVMLFAVIALIVVIYSIYLVTRLGNGPSSDLSIPSDTSNTDINF